MGQFATWVEEARSDGVSNEWIASLAESLASSGEQLAPDEAAADVPSTGGPSSLSTLICPLFLRAAGFVVPKLGVPGRPAGGLDCLAQVTGYRTVFDLSDVRKILAETGYVHFDSGGLVAPLDRSFFAYRQQNDAQTLWPLVIASLLSKKVAVGVSHVGLDVRVAAHGNFGSTRAESETYAARFNQVARLLGLRSLCVLSDNTRPYQPFIGRGEALWAVSEILDGIAQGWLRGHLEECRMLCERLSGQPLRPEPSVLAEHFFANLEAQGASGEAFMAKVCEVRSGHRPAVFAPRPGFLAVDLGQLRDVLLRYQGNSAAGFQDLAGVVLMARPGEFLEEGAPVLSCRCNPDALEDFRAALAGCLAFNDAEGAGRLGVVQ